MTTDLHDLSVAQQRLLEKEMQRASPLYFAIQNISGPVEAPYNGRFIAGEHHYEWDNLVVNSERALIIAPRDHGKSQFFSLAVPIWRAAFGREGDLGYIFSVNQDRAIEILEKIVVEITTNPKLQWLAPRDWEHKWSKRRIRLTTGVEIRARGFGVKTRGAHPQWIICDDVLPDEVATSELIRNRVTDYFLSAITNMIVPGGCINVVGTPMNVLDLYATLKKNGVYKVWEKPAIDKFGNALWPARYNAERLAERLKEIGSLRFAREFQVKPFSDESSLFPSYLFEGQPTQQYMVKLGQTAAYWDALGITTRYMGVDIAISATTGADYFVVFVIGRDDNGNRWVCDLVRERGLSFQAQLDVIVSIGRRLDPGLIFIEANQMQRVWGDELIRTTDLPIKKFITTGTGKGTVSATSQTSNKHSLEKGIPSLVPLFENRKWRIPRGDAYSIETTDIWIQEMQAMSFVDGQVQSVGAHDDTAMACWIADQALRRGGFSVSFGPEADDPKAKKAAAQRDAHAAIRAQQGDAGAVVEGEKPKASGNLGALDGTGQDLWTAVPFHRG